MKKILDFISKKKIKSSLSFSLCFSILFCSLFCFPIFGVNRVSAAENFSTTLKPELQNFVNNNSYSLNVLEDISSNIYSNPFIVNLGWTSSNSLIAVRSNSTNYYIWISSTDSFVSQNGYYVPINNYRYTLAGSDFSSLSSATLISGVLTWGSHTETTANNRTIFDSSGNVQCGNLSFIGNGYQNTNLTINIHNNYTFSYIYNNIVFTSDTLYPLNINVDGFYNWLVDTHKDSNFVSYFNLRSLSQYLQFYSAWGSAPQKFLVFYNIDFGDNFNAHLSNTQIISLKNLTDNLYREYLNSLKFPSVDFPARDRVNVRKDIDTNTTDNNTVLITDDSNDTVIVSILRDILRGVIALKNQIFVTGTDLITGLNNLDFTVNVANNGGTGFSTSDIWGSGDITDSENYLALTAAFMDKGVDVSAVENMEINYLENATQADSFTVSVVMPDQYVNGEFTEKTVTHTIDNTSKMYNTLILFRKLIAFAVVAYFAVRIRFELPNLIRGE